MRISERSTVELIFEHARRSTTWQPQKQPRRSPHRP
jgi:hypothetical protein